jgi:hypothetical protein
MPVHIAAGEQNFTNDVLRANYDYKYPAGLNLRPLSPTHEKLKTEVFRRATESYSVMSERFKGGSSRSGLSEQVTRPVDLITGRAIYWNSGALSGGTGGAHSTWRDRGVGDTSIPTKDKPKLTEKA